jgi:hypothetical protein
MDNIFDKKSKSSINTSSLYKSYKSKKSEEINNQKEKYIKLRYRGKEKKIRFDEFMLVKGLDKQKLQASKDSMIQMMKRKIEFHKNQNEVYNMDILNRISIDRENELRNAVISLQKEIRRKRKRSKEEIELLYQNILNEVRNIYDRTENEIDQRKSDLMDRIMLSIANCDYKQAQLLELKIKEQEELFRQLHMFTFEMQQVRDNFEESVQKIKLLTENNYELKKNIYQEKLKFQHITSLMKEYKIRTNYMASKINEYKTTTHVLENINSNINSSSKKRKKNLFREINFDNIKENKKRPLSSAVNKITSSNLGTNYTRNNTNANFFLDNLKNSKLVEENYNLYHTDREEEKGKGLKLSVVNNEIVAKTEGNLDNFKRKRNYEKNVISVLKKDIEIWNAKIMNIINKYKESIPDNQIYYSLTDIVEELKQDKYNKFFGQYNNNMNNNSMMALPVQNKQFRKIFLDLLFNNKDIFEAIKTGQKNDIDKYFNKNLFGAERIKNK